MGDGGVFSMKREGNKGRGSVREGSSGGFQSGGDLGGGVKGANVRRRANSSANSSAVSFQVLKSDLRIFRTTMTIITRPNCAFCALKADSATGTLHLFVFCSFIFFDRSEKN